MPRAKISDQRTTDAHLSLRRRGITCEKVSACGLLTSALAAPIEDCGVDLYRLQGFSSINILTPSFRAEEVRVG